MTKTKTKESEKHKNKSEKPTEAVTKEIRSVPQPGNRPSDIAQPIDIPLPNNTYNVSENIHGGERKKSQSPDMSFYEHKTQIFYT